MALSNVYRSLHQDKPTPLTNYEALLGCFICALFVLYLCFLDGLRSKLRTEILFSLLMSIVGVFSQFHRPLISSRVENLERSLCFVHRLDL